MADARRPATDGNKARHGRGREEKKIGKTKRGVWGGGRGSSKALRGGHRAEERPRAWRMRMQNSHARDDHGGGWRAEIDRDRDQWPRSADGALSDRNAGALSWLDTTGLNYVQLGNGGSMQDTEHCWEWG